MFKAKVVPYSEQRHRKRWESGSHHTFPEDKLLCLIYLKVGSIGNFPATTSAVIWMFGLPFPSLFWALETRLSCALLNMNGEIIPKSFALTSWPTVTFGQQMDAGHRSSCVVHINLIFCSAETYSFVGPQNHTPSVMSPPWHQWLWKAHKNHSDKRINK